MSSIEKYKWSVITIVIIIAVLMVMIAVGFTIGILSEDPDGLERSLIDAKGEDWLEGLPSLWEPVLGWIGNDYIIGIIGIFLTFFLMVALFHLIISLKKRKQD